MGNATPIKAAAAPVTTELAENLSVTIAGDIATFRVDLSKRLKKSKSGNSTIVATSGGNMVIPGGGGVVLGFNAYIK